MTGGSAARILAGVIVGGLAVALLLGLLMTLAAPAHASSGARVAIPERSALYRHRVEQAATRVWGAEASAARLAAQLHQESAWRETARSPVGAQGMAQFMPATARWMGELFRAELGAFDPWNPQQAILAAALYDRWLLDRVQRIGHTPLGDCSRWAFALRGYNGGELWLLRERAMTIVARQDANNWLHVEQHRARGPAAHRENTHYPRRILLTLEPAYIAAGWPGRAVCT
jgi:hypothetical protein